MTVLRILFAGAAGAAVAGAEADGIAEAEAFSTQALLTATGSLPDDDDGAAPGDGIKI